MRNEKIESLASFQFRDLHLDLFIGTASNRYAGWKGQIYTAERFGRNITRRSKKVGGKTFAEEVLPVQSVEEYFRHFRILELDFTFYLPLLDREEKVRVNVIVNNRAGGNAPLIAQQVAGEFLAAEALTVIKP